MGANVYSQTTQVLNLVMFTVAIGPQFMAFCKFFFLCLRGNGD